MKSLSIPSGATIAYAGKRSGVSFDTYKRLVAEAMSGGFRYLATISKSDEELRELRRQGMGVFANALVAAAFSQYYKVVPEPEVRVPGHLAQEVRFPPEVFDVAIEVSRGLVILVEVKLVRKAENPPPFDNVDRVYGDAPPRRIALKLLNALGVVPVGLALHLQRREWSYPPYVAYVSLTQGREDLMRIKKALETKLESFGIALSRGISHQT